MLAKIPSEWDRKPLRAVATIQTGLAKGKRRSEDTVTLPYLRVANVQDGYLDLGEIKEIEIERGRVERYLLREGDVLLTEGGDFDKLGRGHIWRGEIPVCLHQNHVFVVRTDTDVLDPRFFAALAASPYGKRYFLSCAKQTTNLASINSSQLRAFPVLLPPFAEQRRIVEILGTWDQAIALTEQLIEAKRRRKQGLMQQLLTGKRRFREFRGDDWREVRLGEVFTERRETGFAHLPLLSLSDERGIIYRDQMDRCDTSNPDKSRYLRIRQHDVCYNTMRMWQGRSAISEIEGIVSPAYTVCVPRNTVDPCFVGYLFRLPSIINEFRRYSQGLVSDVWSLRFAAFARIKVRIPGLQEQQAISCLLGACDDDISLLQRKLGLLQEQKKGLMQQLLTGKVGVKV